MADITVYKGNYGQVIPWTLYQADGVTPFNLTGYSVVFKVWEASDPAHPIINTAAGVTSYPLGQVYYETQDTDFTQAGNYEAAFSAVAAGTADITFTQFTIQVLDNA